MSPGDNIKAFKVYNNCQHRQSKWKRQPFGASLLRTEGWGVECLECLEIKSLTRKMLIKIPARKKVRALNADCHAGYKKVGTGPQRLVLSQTLRPRPSHH